MVFEQLKVSVSVRPAEEFLWKISLLNHCTHDAKKGGCSDN